MFKRRGKGIKEKIVAEKKKPKFSVKKWFKSKFTRITRSKEPVHVTPPIPAPKSAKAKLKDSVVTLFRTTVKKSKVNVRDIELIEGLDAAQLKKRYSITGSKAKLLEGMVTDYKGGKLSLPGLSHKSKFDKKSLNREKLNEMIADYKEGKRKNDFEELQNNANVIKKRFDLSKSDGNKLDKVVQDINKGTGSKLTLAKTLLDPKKLTKDRVQTVIKQYAKGQKQNRGLSYVIAQSKLSLAISKRKIHNLMEDFKDLNLSGKFKK